MTTDGFECENPRPFDRPFQAAHRPARPGAIDTPGPHASILPKDLSPVPPGAASGRNPQQGGVPAIIPEYEVDPDASGRTASFQPLRPTTTAGNAFFQSLGNNGRTCVTCHLPPNAMSVSVQNINARWIATTGNDPIFAPVDGADCPNKVAPTNSRAAHSLLLDRGLFRIFLAIPDNPEFTVTVLHDPTDSATTQPPFNKDGCNTDPTYAAPPNSSGKPVRRCPCIDVRGSPAI